MKPLSPSVAWSETLSFMRREAGLVLPVAFALIGLPSALLQLVMPAPDAGPEAVFGSWALFLIPAILVSLVGTLTITVLALRSGIAVGEALSRGLRRFLPTLAASMLLAAGISILFFAVVVVLAAVTGAQRSEEAEARTAVLALIVLIPAFLFVWTRFTLITPVAAAEDVGVIGILRRSWDITRGQFWRIFGLMLLLVLAAFVVILAVSLILGVVVTIAAGGAPEPGSFADFVVILIACIVNAVVAAFFAILFARVYVQLAEPSSGS